MRALKKPASAISIDLPPKLLNRFVGVLSPVLTHIINGVRTTGVWPSIWKLAEETIIPKKESPESLDECRNISCTSVFSKLCESYLLEDLQKEVTLSVSQYGGIKGSGPDHYLVDLLTDLNSALDDNRACVSLLAIDFQKAFNRMNHQVCLSALAARGASNQTLNMAAAFLDKRSMCVKVGSVKSTTRLVPGGAPQGTKCGNFLFCVSVQDIEKPDYIRMIDPESTYLSEPTPGAEQSLPPDGSFLRPIAAAEESLDEVERYGNPESPENLAVDPNFEGYDLQDNLDLTITRRAVAPIRRLETIREETTRSHNIEEPELERWERVETHSKLFIDDNTIFEKVPVDRCLKNISEVKEIRWVHAKDSERMFETVCKNAEVVGMKVNRQKTQLLCVSASKNYDVRSFIHSDGKIVQSGDSLKVIGFTLGRKPCLEPHVATIKRKVLTKIWMLRHLKRTGVNNETLKKIYVSMLRPHMEYACVSFNDLLTIAQSDSLERLQAIAMKIIYGTDISYNKSLELSGLQTLRDRRVELVRAFAEKNEKGRYSEKWFPRNISAEYSLRAQNYYIEHTANCERLKNSPVFVMRNYLNQMYRQAQLPRISSQI